MTSKVEQETISCYANSTEQSMKVQRAITIDQTICHVEKGTNTQYAVRWYGCAAANERI